MDKLQAIRFFLKLGETLSFKVTAEHFGVPPSTVSRSLKRLEDELGVSLVHRTTRQVRLTESGEWYRAEVIDPLRALSVAEDMVQQQSLEPAGTVRITAVHGYGEMRLFSVLDRFRAMYPRIVCDVELTDKALDLSTGEIDVALRVTNEPPQDLVARRLHTNRFALVASPNYLQRHGRPETVADLVKHPALLYRSQRGISPWFATQASGKVVPVDRTPKLISNNGFHLLRAAIDAEGLAFLPLWGLSKQLEEGRLEIITLEDASLTIGTGENLSMYMLYHPMKTRLGKVRVLVDFLLEGLVIP